MKQSFAKVPTNVMFDVSISLEAKGLYALLLCLQGSMDYCYPKISWMESKTGYKPTKIKKMLKELIIKGLIQRSKDHQNRTVTQVAKLI